MNILGGDGREEVQGWAQVVALDRGKGGFFIVRNLELRFVFFWNHVLGFLSAGAEDFAGHLKACQVTLPDRGSENPSVRPFLDCCTADPQNDDNRASK